VENVKIEGNLLNLINELSDDLYALELLVFFSRHPHTRFNRAAVFRAVGNRPYDTAVALKRLMEKEIVVAYNENKTMLYSLTKDEVLHNMCSQIINIDQQQWRLILEHILDVQGI
jgi:hypothetical protein